MIKLHHYCDVIMGENASQTTSLTIVYLIVYSDTDQRKYQNSASLAFVRGIHRGPVNSPHKWPVTRKMLPFDDVIVITVRKMSALVSQIRDNFDCLFTCLSRLTSKQILKLHIVVLREGNHLPMVDYPHKWPVKWKEIPSHGVIRTISVVNAQ